MSEINYELTHLPRTSTPEEGGVSSKVIKEFIDACDAIDMRLHSMLVIRGGKICAECNWAPYKAEVPHTMFSFSKPVTAIAIGFAISEGLLDLDDKVSKFFPFNEGSKKHREYNEEVTVRHLITHRSGKKISIANNAEKNEWLHNWLAAPFNEKPGTKFNYLSENIYMLSRIVSKVTGEGLVEYLTPRLFEPLGIEPPFWETDHNGFAAGGWGAYFTVEDMGKIGMLYLNRGKYNGKQVLPEEWIDMSTVRHVKNIPSVFNDDSGYGFQVFIQKDETGTFSFNGLYSQFAVMFRDYDAVFVCTAGDPREDEIMKLLWKHFPACFTETVPAPEAPKELEAYRAALADCDARHPEKGARQAESEEKLSGKILSTNRKGTASILGTGNLFMLSHRTGEIDNFRFSFADDRVTVDFKEKNSPVSTLEAGMNGQYLYSTIKLSSIDVQVASFATWMDANTFKLTVVPIQMAQYREFTFTFDESGKVKVKSEAKPGFRDLFEFYLMFNGTRPGAFLNTAIRAVASVMTAALDPNFKGKLS